MDLANKKIFKKSEEAFNDLNLIYKKTILISTEANSWTNSMNNKDWCDVAIFCKNLGYSVIFNSSLKEFYNFPSIFLSPLEMLGFARLCGNFIGFRSGFCDIICGFNNNMKSFIIYPDNVNIVANMNIMYNQDKIKE